MLHVGPTAPDVPDDPLEPELPLEPDEPLDPLDPDEPLDPEDPLDPLDPLDPELPLDPVSGFAASCWGIGGGGSFTPPSSGVVAFVCAAVAPATGSSGDVAQAEAAEMRAPSDNATMQVMLERRMADTLAAELCRLCGPHPSETRR